ncbi:MAG: glycoside hydrolase family 1 protein [Candidatus Omnitrophota bacterium]
MAQTLLFPKNFLWGSATSAYQVEGANFNNDWYCFEKQGKLPHICAKATDSYNRYEEDFNLAKTLAQNCHRLSFEWSRIEPLKNQFDEKEIAHYKKVILSLKEKNITPIVTLHHFTNPIWFYQSGGWLNPSSRDYFAQYVEEITKEFSSLVEYWITINEPVVYCYYAYIQGIWPPQEKSFKKAKIVLKNLINAHLKAYHIIHKNIKGAKVSIAQNTMRFIACPLRNFGQNTIPVFLRDRFYNFGVVETLIKKRALDFIGLNYYGGVFLKFSFKHIFGKDCSSDHHKIRKNSLGWLVMPEGIFDIIMQLKKFNLPILITENGTSEKDDSFYGKYLKEHLFYIAMAINKGANVIGYLWWSLLDNFEWDKGFSPKFGLLCLDKDLNRTIKPFAALYKDICTNNRIDYA